MLNLITDDLLSLSSGAATTLPGLFAHLLADGVDTLPALRPHQKQAIHCFLVQTGAMAMLAAGVSEPPTVPERWAELLRGLTPGFENDEPWCLVVDDLSKPAFMQPPVPEGSWAPLGKREDTPDSLDMLVTSRNHDVKASRLSLASPEHWLFTLICVQTSDGIGGSGNYGISRMNKGHGSRPFVGAAPITGGWGAHVRRDLEALVKRRAQILEGNSQHSRNGGIGLLWLEPWDGCESLSPAKLDPYYVEICRRIRLRYENGRIIARRGRSQGMRIAQPKIPYKGKEHTLPTRDPWAPIQIDGYKPLTIDGTGFNYRRVVDLLDSEKFELAPLQILGDSENRAAMQLVFVATVRGEGGTDGYHERRILVPPKAVPFFMRKSPSPRLASLARQRVQDVSEASSNALKPALFNLFQSAPTKIDYKDPKAKGKAELYLAAFYRSVDEKFFDLLFAELVEESETDAARRQRRIWIESLETHALDILATAEAGSPLSHVRRYRARAAAQGVLVGALRRHFKDVFSEAA